MSHTILCDEWIKKHLLCDSDRLDKILDIGCGYGLWGFWLRGELGFKGHLVGLDIDQDFLNSYTTRALYNERISINLEDRLPSFKDNSFDCVICSHVLEHLARSTGLKLLEWIKKLTSYQVMITLPFGDNLYKDPEKSHMSHISAWTPTDFHSQGYTTKTFNTNDGRVPSAFLTTYIGVKNILLGNHWRLHKDIVAWYYKTENGDVHRCR